MVRGCKLYKDEKNMGTEYGYWVSQSVFRCVGFQYFMANTECPNDHTHCHWCREEGHIALHCPKAGGYSFEPE